MKTLFSALFVISIVLLSSCEKSEKFDPEQFIGTWISTDLVDTIEFATENDLYKRIYSIRDHFDYTATKDSITIRYNGVLYIGSIPTTHRYRLTGDELIIDFRPQCYGFRNELIIFSRN